ncbi:MAG: PD-(D/E)XK nuclease family protein [Candidatus Zapsychrus exili]|nr:PD-(D/E)XK nuclease family protein [Candidatus Zapsychrus exili]
MGKVITYSFCEDFLENLKCYIKENYIDRGLSQKGQTPKGSVPRDCPPDLSRVAIVFGGKRPSLFLKRKLAKELNTSFYPPRFFSIDEFISFTARKKKSFGVISDLDNCYLIYKLAQDVSCDILEGRESFDKFLPWAREILRFIDSLDIENISNDALLQVRANAEIGYDVPDDINKILKSVLLLRQEYHKSLESQNTYSRGYQYLFASKCVEDIAFDEFDQILFCNFFYFHKTEEDVIKSLYKKDKATLIFQGDAKRWPILERIQKSFNCKIEEVLTFPDYKSKKSGSRPPSKSLGKVGSIKRPEFNLNIYSGFDVHAQVGLAKHVLKTIKKTDNTLIVLPNPEAVIPLIGEISSLSDNFNVSVGYPLKRSSLYSLLGLIINSQKTFKTNKYYTKDYIKALSHPFVKNLHIAADVSATRILMHKIEEILTGKQKTDISGSSFVSLDSIEKLDELYSLTLETTKRLKIEVKREELVETLKQIHEIVFKGWENITSLKDFSCSLQNCLDILVNKSFLKNYPLNINIAERMYRIKEEFDNVSFVDEKLDSREIFRIFDNKISREVISFSGSPLKGLQVLGLLETRSLNFENVIVLDVNEGVLPKLNVYEPLIPREIMISLGLDRLELEEEIQRYQFMRIISSAKNVHLIYQESKEKEKSRFIEELIWDQQKKENKIDVIDIKQASFDVKVHKKEVAVKKTKEMVEFLKGHTFSASSINTYLKNPMEFYYNYVLRLRETDDLLDEPEARHVGTFVHELLEDAFKPFVNKVPIIDKAFENKFFDMFEDKFTDTFEKSMKSDAFLLKSVIRERLSRFLENERTNEQRQIEKIMFLENNFEDSIELSCGKIKFRYIVDRIDRLKDGTVMVIDYKTGIAEKLANDIEKFASMKLSRESIRDNIKSFQVPLYFNYLSKEFKGETIDAALYNLRTLVMHRFINPKSNYSYDQINQVFLKSLDFVVSEILNPDVDFVLDI